jgi:DNA invertase Pin-like site-specific DNA recombinase
MLAKYVEEHGWTIIGYYIDDGYSGTAFDRPDFLRMLSDIENKKINMVITKDLSRLGRDYIQTGYYLEVYFPQKNVRFIALNDSIDTVGYDNDIAPFKNILNEMYAKDISKKIRAAFRTKAENGEFIGAVAPFGYKKHPENKNRLIIDQEAAEVVKRAFEMVLMGYGLNKIARVFNSEGILNPTMYKRQQGLAYVNNLRLPGTTYWTYSTIRKMLTNIVYTGVLAQGKQRTKSFKCKKKVSCNENDWVVVEGTHEPIISFETWEAVQNLLAVRKRTMADGETHIFAGLLKCIDCGRFMSLGRKANGYRYFVCGTYKNYGPDCCSRHGIRYDYLYHIILNDIRYHVGIAKYDEDAIIGKLVSAQSVNRTGIESKLKSELMALRSREHEIDLVFRQLYEDRIKGNITESRFLQLSQQYEDELAGIKLKHEEALERLNTFETDLKDINYWANTIKRYTCPVELNKGIMDHLVEKILIGDRKVIDGCTVQEVKIVYKFAGCDPV